MFNKKIKTNTKKVSLKDKIQKNREIKKEKKEKAKKDKIIKKEQEKREQERISDENKPVIWNYEGDADITIGDVKISNIAKIILIVLIAVLLISGIFGFFNREKIIDSISKPKIILTDSEVKLSVGEEFDYSKYLADQKYSKKYKITYPDNSLVDTTKVGTYKVQYKLKTSVGTNVTDLTVKVVDSTPPKLKLKKSVISLVRGSQTKKFKPKKYIKSYSDNYDNKKDLKISYTKNFDWSKDEVEVKYTVEDTSGNKTTKKLIISVNDPPEDNPETSESSQSSSSSSSGNSSSSSSSSSSGGSSSPSSSSGSNSSSSSSSSSSGSSSSTPYISGVHDITVSEGSDFSSMVSKLTSGVQGSGYISVDYSSVNLTSPGSYTVTFSSDDGVTKYATVTVK